MVNKSKNAANKSENSSSIPSNKVTPVDVKVIYRVSVRIVVVVSNYSLWCHMVLLATKATHFFTKQSNHGQV